MRCFHCDKVDLAIAYCNEIEGSWVRSPPLGSLSVTCKSPSPTPAPSTAFVVAAVSSRSQVPLSSADACRPSAAFEVSRCLFAQSSPPLLRRRSVVRRLPLKLAAFSSRSQVPLSSAFLT